ncbi:MAG: 5-(carboxyamino)imidazole ribonucleotide mutase [Desulfobacterales bacterium]
MGSDSDYDIMKQAADILKNLACPMTSPVASAHRTPDRAVNFVKNAEKNGVKAIIAGAGHAAHLAGALAGHTILPIIGVPIDSSALNGMDALLSTVQMPLGVPVATMAIEKSGAKNAGILRCRCRRRPRTLQRLRNLSRKWRIRLNKSPKTR